MGNLATLRNLIVRTAISATLAGARGARRSFMSEMATRSLMTSRSLLEKQQDLRGRVAGTYYFTSEKGLYRIDPDGIWKVLDVPCYGIALRDHWVFLSVYWPHLRGRSSVIRGGRRSLAEPGRSLAFRELDHVTTSS